MLNIVRICVNVYGCGDEGCEDYRCNLEPKSSTNVSVLTRFPYDAVNSCCWCGEAVSNVTFFCRITAKQRTLQLQLTPISEVLFNTLAQCPKVTL